MRAPTDWGAIWVVFHLYGHLGGFRRIVLSLGCTPTKMIPNNQFDADTRFRRLVEAIKFVYASTYFREARDYIRTTGHQPAEEKMAVIIQEVVGQRHGDRFYPELSGVGRSYNFYSTPPARPEMVS